MPPSPANESYGAALAQTLIALAGVCALAWWMLRWGARRGLGRHVGARVEVLERASLDARSTLFVVRIGKRVLVLGAGPQSITTLAELSESELPAATPAPPSLLDTLLDRVKSPRASAPREDA